MRHAMSALTLRDLAAYHELGRVELSNAEVRDVVRRLLAGDAHLREVGPSLRTASFDLRYVTAGDSTLSGTASAYGVEYPVGGGRFEVIEYPAFRGSLASQGGVVPIFWNHGMAAGSPWTAAPIGVARASELPDGLHTTFSLFTDDSSEARTIARAARAGALRELSVGYAALDVAQDRTATGAPLERVRCGALIEISVVARGASPVAQLDAA